MGQAGPVGVLFGEGAADAAPGLRRPLPPARGSGLQTFPSYAPPPSHKPKAFNLAARWVRGWVIPGPRPSPGATSQVWPGLLQIHPLSRGDGCMYYSHAVPLDTC